MEQNKPFYETHQLRDFFKTQRFLSKNLHLSDVNEKISSAPLFGLCRLIGSPHEAANLATGIATHGVTCHQRRFTYG